MVILYGVCTLDCARLSEHSQVLAMRGMVRMCADVATFDWVSSRKIFNRVPLLVSDIKPIRFYSVTNCLLALLSKDPCYSFRASRTVLYGSYCADC